MSGYEIMGRASMPSHYAIEPRRALPAIGGAMIGLLAWPTQPFFGLLSGAALAHNLVGVARDILVEK